ncbi:uncharacterized protein LOC111602477 [Drosophila hydei]|uniref:Uncharacterized protein LOC111602477 n=1 Tax=Drosophila hydei TaxID=7224 RepID=A0A6J2SNB4_DROHY|nr:uncharacterized protein LOC111602477 [Drosophila hydei]
MDDTKHLLDQIIRKKFDLTQPTQRTNQSESFSCRKRKRIITKQTTVCVAKRARVIEPQLLDEQNVDYYRHMLTESQQWNTQTENVAIEQSQTIEVARTCLPEHTISVTHELTFTEIDQDIMWNNGFGESNQVDITAFEEFLPARNAVKRKSLDLCTTGALCYKMPRLATDTIMGHTNDNPQASNPSQELNLDMEVLAMSPKKAKTKSKRKMKLARDQVIKISRQELLRDREIYYKALERERLRKSKILKNNNTRNTLLSSFRQSQHFPDCLKRQLQLSSEQIESDCELTIRSIFGADYCDELSREILSVRPLSPKQTDALEIAALPALELEPTVQHSPPTIEVPQCGNNNNNNYITYNYDICNIDSLGIMMHLLSIWRNNPDLKSIDANKFVKSFPDRFKAALAFSHLLSLAKDGFIELTTKRNSLEIHEITLGAESNRLIEENLTN